MSKLDVKQIPGFGGWILCQMILSRDGTEALNKPGDCGTVRICRGIILQHDTQVIIVSGWPAGSALPEFDGRPGRYRRRGRRRQIARDLVNLRGREAVLFVFFAATGKNREKEANPQAHETCRTVYLNSKAMRACLNRVRLPGHGKLSSLFHGGL